MRVVLDTNVVVSRFLSPTGAPAQIFNLWEQEAFEVAASEAILAEYAAALRYPKVRVRHRLTDEELDEILEGLRSQVIPVEPAKVLSVVSQDPEDDQFLACAVAAEAEYLLSGDAHLLRLGQHQGIPILSPREFLLVLKQQGL